MTSRSAPIISLVPFEKYDDLLPYFEGLQVVLQSLPIATETVIVTSNSYAVTSEDYLLVDDDTIGGPATINLPIAAKHNEEIKQIKKLGSTGNVVIVANGDETIDGASSNTLTTQYDNLTIVSDGSNWFIL